jgi:hypothetical protein
LKPAPSQPSNPFSRPSGAASSGPPTKENQSTPSQPPKSAKPCPAAPKTEPPSSSKSYGSPSTTKPAGPESQPPPPSSSKAKAKEKKIGAKAVNLVAEIDAVQEQASSLQELREANNVARLSALDPIFGKRYVQARANMDAFNVISANHTHYNDRDLTIALTNLERQNRRLKPYSNDDLGSDPVLSKNVDSPFRKKEDLKE